ncbi:RNA 2',3'-cyclic phosphodiesterase [Salidesulfovibrio onnuriiensis]|uniref:RNA 2',3'-cyclic phosphodiesterase n=1 Tax=Salidesulfovibrio onnuriiensis TaxID=2583823 RepID=UPI0011C7EE97|nr:RNA 2',3'-cyclic phosphodiesterase [Salidesulfovibrio onnuriiensis]
MRCFIGLPMPPRCQQGLERLAKDLKPGLRSRLSWTRSATWHLTLKFLGEISESTASAVREALAGVSFRSFPMQAGGPGYFPNERKPRVLWLGLAQGAAQCRELFSDLEEALSPLGIEPEQRPFRAHLTLARIREDRGDDWKALLGRVRGQEWEPFSCDELVFWKSDLTPQGPVYTRLLTRRAED